MSTLKYDLVIAVYDWHSSAERAIEALHDAGSNMKRVSMVIRHGAFRGRLHGMLLESAPLFIPVHGAMLALGSFAADQIRRAREVIEPGDSTALTDALILLGMSLHSASRCADSFRANDFILAVHGDERDLCRVRELLETTGFVSLIRPNHGDLHEHSLLRNRTADRDDARESGLRQPAR